MEAQEDPFDTRECRIYEAVVWHRKHVRHGEFNGMCYICAAELELVRGGK